MYRLLFWDLFVTSHLDQYYAYKNGDNIIVFNTKR